MKTRNVLILHGWGGSDYPHWQAKLAQKLLHKNFNVSFPQLPNKDLPNLKIWLKSLHTQMIDFKPDIIICHSLANILWFHYQNNYTIQKVIDKLILVSPVSNDCKIKELKSFFPYTIPKQLNASKHIVICGDNDPYINLQELNILQKKLNTQILLIENGGHLNIESGHGDLHCVDEWITIN